MRRETINAKKEKPYIYRLILEGLVPGPTGFGPWIPGSWLIIRVDFRQFQSSIFASPLARAPFSIASLSENLD